MSHSDCEGDQQADLCKEKGEGVNTGPDWADIAYHKIMRLLRPYRQLASEIPPEVIEAVRDVLRSSVPQAPPVREKYLEDVINALRKDVREKEQEIEQTNFRLGEQSKGAEPGSGK